MVACYYFSLNAREKKRGSTYSDAPLSAAVGRPAGPELPAGAGASPDGARPLPREAWRPQSRKHDTPPNATGMEKARSPAAAAGSMAAAKPHKMYALQPHGRGEGNLRADRSKGD